MIGNILRSNPAPYRGFIVDVVKYQNFSALRIYSDNFEEFSEPQKGLLLEWLNSMLKVINQYTPCRLEREAHVPR